MNRWKKRANECEFLLFWFVGGAVAVWLDISIRTSFIFAGIALALFLGFEFKAERSKR